MFELIPALDLMDGHVVRARRGERHRYAPLDCTLCPTSDPFAVVDALRSQYHFGTLYVADLDAITGRGHHDRVLTELSARYPTLVFWVDQGIHERRGPWHSVLGSESLRSLDPLRRPARHVDAPSLLSLDFRGHRLMGPPDLWLRSADWPRDIILMQLRRVGSGQGPDLALMHRVQRQLGRKRTETRLYAAGGVRDVADLDRLRRLGAAGVLLAGALYDGTLNAARLRAWAEGTASCT